MSLSAIQEGAKTQAESIIEGAARTIEALEASFQTLFPFKTLSEATAQFSAGDVTAPNQILTTALAASQEALDSVATSCLTMERYVLLTIPKMEDGNNFGVTVQLAAVKELKEGREALLKQLEELMKYASSRADAMEKCKLASTNMSKTTTSSTSNNDTKGGEKAGTTSTTASSSEEKSIETSNHLAEIKFRQQAVWAVDALYYSKARNAYMSALTCFMTAVDFLEKNSEKIAQPKGSGGRGFSSMY